MKLKRIGYVLAVMVVVGIVLFEAAHNPTDLRSGVRRVEAAEFRNVLKDSTVVVLDVRTAGEHRQGAIPGTDFNIDVKSGDFAEQVRRSIPQGSVVAIYCRSGNRSRKAAAILADEGYEVVELSSGYKGWKNLPEQV